MSTKKADKTQANGNPQAQPEVNYEAEKLVLPEKPKIILPNGPEFINPYDNLDEHAANPDEMAQLGVQSEKSEIPVGKRHDQIWIRVHPTYHRDFAMLVLKGEGSNKTFIPVTNSFAKQIEDDIKWMTLYIGTTRSHTPFVWPIRIVQDRKDTWAATERECAEKAMKKWIRVLSDQPSSCFYDREAQSIQVEPVFPKMTFNEILNVAFKGDMVMSMEHPAIKELYGVDD